MALFRTGGMIGQISGKLGPNVFSRNRYGTYIRARVSPVSGGSPALEAAKGILSAASQGYRQLTQAQRLAWATWAQTNPITNRLGDSQILAPNAAYTQIASNLLWMDQALPTDPPVGEAPAPLESVTAAIDIGAGASALTFTPSPLGANVRLWIRAAVVDSESIVFVKNLRKLIAISDANDTSPYDPETELAARFGTLQAGQVVHFLLQTADESTGLISAGRTVSTTIVST